jgi:hypothetical protein
MKMKEGSLESVYPVGHFLHLCLMVGTNRTLMVAKNGNFPITVIVKFDFLLNADVRILEFLKEG